MKPSFITHNDISLAETGSVGSVETDYSNLVEHFGERDTDTPPDGKTDVLWFVMFTRKRLATVYNWKDGPNYRGAAGTPVERIRLWNTGSRSTEVVKLIAQVLGLKDEVRDELGFPRFK